MEQVAELQTIKYIYPARFHKSYFMCYHTFLIVFVAFFLALKHHPVVTKYGTEKKGLTAYVLTPEEMIKNHYPVKGKPIGYAADSCLCALTQVHSC